MDQRTDLRKEPEEIRTDIEQTRGEMGETIDEIKERLSSEHLKARVRDATVGRAKRVYDSAATKTRDLSSSAVEAVREKPLRYALIGAGVGIGIGTLVYFLRKRRSEYKEAGSFDECVVPGVESHSHSQPGEITGCGC